MCVCVCVNLGRTYSRTTIRQSLPINHMTQIGIRRERERGRDCKLQRDKRRHQLDSIDPIKDEQHAQHCLPLLLPTPPLREWECKSEYASESESQAKYVFRDTHTHRHIRDASKTRKKNNMKIPNTHFGADAARAGGEGGECSSTSCQAAKSPVA